MDLDLGGRIAFFNACFGAGTPQYDAYSRLLNRQQLLQPGTLKQLTPHPFVADLPRRMLSASPRGALAVISHIERTWSGTFLQGGFLQPQTDVFESVIYDILRGKPVGAAMEHLNGWRSNLSAHLTPIMEEVAFRNEEDAQFFRRLQGAIDAQWYAVVGDPAAHL